jgi:hypothetical protein
MSNLIRIRTLSACTPTHNDRMNDSHRDCACHDVSRCRWVTRHVLSSSPRDFTLFCFARNPFKRMFGCRSTACRKSTTIPFPSRGETSNTPSLNSTCREIRHPLNQPSPGGTRTTIIASHNSARTSGQNLPSIVLKSDSDDAMRSTYLRPPKASQTIDFVQ